MIYKLLYGIRWQLSGIVLIPSVYYYGDVYGVIVGNLVGAIIFWNVDKWLTRDK